MGIFTVTYTYPDDMAPQLEVRPAHRAWLAEQDWILVAGMFQAACEVAGPGDAAVPANAALLVARGESAESIAELMNEDPYWHNGFVVQRVIREWNPPLGSRPDVFA